MTDTALPGPLVDAEVDLRDFAYMPIDVHRMRTSETWVLGTGDERAAAMALWLASWHELPAGSVPDDDRMLAHLAQSSRWKKVKAHALRGWVRCSDGRLYHPVVCEKALEAWIEKLVNSLSGTTGNAKRWGLDVDVSATRAQLLRALELLRPLAPQSKTFKKKAVLTILSGSRPESRGDEKPSGGDPVATSPSDSPPIRHAIATGSPSDRKGEKRDYVIPKANAFGPAEPAAEGLSAKERAWALGVAVLGERQRSLLGKLAKQYGEDVLAEVLAEAQAQMPLHDARSWVIAACEVRKAKAPTGGRRSGEAAVDLLADPRPQWALDAGFPDRFQAENAGCLRGNAHLFRGGRRLEESSR